MSLIAPQPIHAIVLAAGKGTRLKSDLPKVLHPLFGRPMLLRVLDTLADVAQTMPVECARVVVGHGRERVQAVLATEEATENSPWPFTVVPITQEPQLGTGHAVLQVKQSILADNNSLANKTVLILSGDVPLLQATSIQQLLEAHAAQKNHLTVLTATLENPFGYGRVITQGTDPVYIQKIVEERDASAAEKAVRQVNTGIYCLNWSSIAPLLDELTANNAQQEFYLTDVVALAVQQGLRVGIAQLDDPAEMTGVNSRQDLALCHQLLNQRTLEHLMSQGVTLIDPDQTWISPEATIGADTVIYPGCFLEGHIDIGQAAIIGPNTSLFGPVRIGDRTHVLHSVVKNAQIGDDTTVGPFAHIRDGAALSHHVRVGNFVEVKNTQIGPYSNAAHLAYLGDATLGSQVNMGAGSITANYDPIREQKHRTTIADGVKIGCNAVLVAPVTIKQDACVAAGSVITEDVAATDLAIARPKQTAIPGWVTKTREQGNQ